VTSDDLWGINLYKLDLTATNVPKIYGTSILNFIRSVFAG